MNAKQKKNMENYEIAGALHKFAATYRLCVC